MAANLGAPVDVTTVLGNLLDNAIEAAREQAAAGGTDVAPAPECGTDEPPVVEVELVQEGETLHLTVADSGAGVAVDLVDSVFSEGVSTRSGSGVPGGRGVGLALSRQVARARGGEVWLAHPGGGAVSSVEPDGSGPVAATGRAAEKPLRGAEFIARLPGALTEGEPAWAEQK
ncbi:GHKL domain-containing protein [Nocardia sp. SYP-A9097]|uniref:sensor histidine kinase n=1 Tax=Nocardia sp. SYP-A9097 TaxID=2663237 RepID=UPI00132C6B63|nr:ATP-binding protein [Nocardia sp. SYP-A9097]MRH90050.1 GHKL domain-containing protein [Nocardia sp. SYP-A9097]